MATLISGISDNALFFGSPQEGCTASDETQRAAQNLMDTIFSGKTGRWSIRSVDEVLRGLDEPIRQRKAFVSALADARGVSQPAMPTDWSPQQWRDWYAREPLSDQDMTDAVKQWKRSFPMHRETVLKIEQFIEKNTRTSKKQAKDLKNGAFKVYCREDCISHQLAMIFLQHPATAIHILLAAWAKYMQSPEYAAEKARSGRVDEADALAVAEKERQVTLKLKVYRLRHKLRQKNSQIEKQDLEQELDALTREHGYGLLRADNEYVGPARLSSFV